VPVTFCSRGVVFAYGEVYHRAVGDKSKRDKRTFADAWLARLEVRVRRTHPSEIEKVAAPGQQTEVI
jgi:hypothetical protein